MHPESPSTARPANDRTSVRGRWPAVESVTAVPTGVADEGAGAATFGLWRDDRGRVTLGHMTKDTKWVVGTGIAVITAVVGSAVAVIAVVVTLTGGIRADLRDMNRRLKGFDNRLRAVEIAFGKIAQSLETLERLHLPTPPADQ